MRTFMETEGSGTYRRNDGSLTSVEAARILGVAPTTVVRLLGDGKITGHRETMSLPGSTRPRYIYRLNAESVYAYKAEIDAYRRSNT